MNRRERYITELREFAGDEIAEDFIREEAIALNVEQSESMRARLLTVVEAIDRAFATGVYIGAALTNEQGEAIISARSELANQLPARSPEPKP